MYFLVLFGTLNVMRWVVCAANCLVSAQSRRTGN
jgi:hypothetical protein